MRDVDAPPPPRPAPRLAPVHPTEGLVSGRAARDREGGRHDADRDGWTPIHRRRLLAVVQPAWPPSPADRQSSPRPAGAGCPLDDARALTSGCDRAGRTPG